MWKNKFIRLYLSSVIILITIQTEAQPGLSSPYSNFGLGYLSDGNNIRNKSMGSIGIGTRDCYTINVYNPASYTAFDSTSFVFEGGIVGLYNKLKTNTINEEITTGSISHLLFGFPVTKWWRSSFGLLPFSNIGYNVVDYEYKNNIGNTQYEYEGTGGISRFFWGNAFKPAKFLSFGINASYLFGTIDRVQTVAFPDSLYLIGTHVSNSITIRDFDFDIGIQIHTELKKNLKLIVGGVFHPRINLNAERNYLAQTYLRKINNVEIFRDTIAYTPEEKGTILIPIGFGLGFSLAKEDKWLIGADYKHENWKEFKSFDINDSLCNSNTYAIGLQYTPDKYSITSYLKRIDYRIGARYSQSYLDLRNKHINGFGITFGVGLPLRSVSFRGTKSMLNLGFEIGQRGTTVNNLIQENYFKIYFGVSIYEWWFIKRRYN